MTMLTTRRATHPPADPTTPTPTGLDARLAAVDAAMTVRLETAALAAAVDARHPETQLNLNDVITGPVHTTPAPTETPYPTPIAATLQRARHLLHARGWCQNTTRSTDGALCLYGAVRAAAPNGAAVTDALTVLLEAIRRRYPADSVPHANDEFLRDAHAAERALAEGASLADARGR